MLCWDGQCPIYGNVYGEAVYSGIDHIQRCDHSDERMLRLLYGLPSENLVNGMGVMDVCHYDYPAVDNMHSGFDYIPRMQAKSPLYL